MASLRDLSWKRLGCNSGLILFIQVKKEVIQNGRLRLKVPLRRFVTGVVCHFHRCRLAWYRVHSPGTNLIAVLENGQKEE